MTIQQQEKVALHVVRKSDVRNATLPAWNDPHKLAGFTPEKRSAILDNPLSRSDDDPVQILGLQGETVIGKIDLIAGELIAGDQPVPVLWTSEYIVPPEHRHTLVGVMIVLKMQQLASVVAACGISHQALPIFEKLKWLDLPMRRFLLLRRSRAVVERYAGTGIAGKALTALADAGLLVQRGLLGAMTALRASGLKAEPLARMPEELAPKLAMDEAPAHFHRSVAWTNWLLGHRFESDPRNRHGLLIIRDRDHTPLAHVLLKAHFHASATHRGFKDLLLGSVQDWMIDDRGRVSPGQLMLLALRELLAWKVDAVEVCLPPDWKGPSPRAWGFVPVGHLHCMVRAAPKSPAADERFKATAAWSVRPAEGDNFFI